MDDLTPNGLNPTPYEALKNELRMNFIEALGKDHASALSETEEAFLYQCLEDYEPEELPDLRPQDLSRLLAKSWLKADTRTSATVIKAVTPISVGEATLSAYDVIEVIQSDAPFIVESIMGELIEQGLSVRAMFHPVIKSARDGNGKRQDGGEITTESFILVIIGRQPPEKHEAILNGIALSLNDLRAAVFDFPRMRKLLAQEIQNLATLKNHPKANIEQDVIDENLAFLRWVEANHFVLLGARGYSYPRDDSGQFAPQEPLSLSQEEFGVLRDKRPVLRRANEPALLSRELLIHLKNSEPVTVAKGNLKSRVHRRVYMDYFSIKRFDDEGKPSGETRFVGLFTSDAYDRPAFEVPLIRKKCEHVLSEARRIGFSNGGYSEKRLKNILESYPRDELFQMTEDDLVRITRGILHISDRPRVKLFARHDPFDRFISILFYMPREAYQVTIQSKAGDILAKAYGGRVSAAYPYMTGGMLSCIHYIIGVTPGGHLEPDMSVIEDEIEDLTRGWPQKVEALALEEGFGDLPILSYARALPLGFQDRFSTLEAVTDIEALVALTADIPVSVRAYKRPEDAPNQFCFKVFHQSIEAIALSDILPVLERMGLRTLEEYGYCVEAEGIETYWIHEFILELPANHPFGFESFRADFEDTLMAVWSNKTEIDGFNALVLTGLNWREAALIRALCRYRAQSGLDPSQVQQQQALIINPAVVEALLELFVLKFDLSDVPIEGRKASVEACEAKISSLLQAVASLEHDRVLRRLYVLIKAILRTNYYQTKSDGHHKDYISFKIASRELTDLPDPKPYREIFVWSPSVEGVHLRFGPVARGGLRWSDRKDDFRTEVLGLVKAQQVKNAVIVPVGSKGGFYPKKLPTSGTPEDIKAEAISAYKTFLSGLLDLTDNLDAQGATIAPPHVVSWDGPDPYLVVAADKGTATFSDIANGLASDYGFWLDDAFASGGSVGYDHKVMGITAKGAWEAIKRHFRERGKDIQYEAFTCIGVGDMSGDVFGNGMLLSKHTHLLAAFDHRDIFIDPSPDKDISFAERERLFSLTRSSWQDYDKALISKGGGVFSRSLKSISLTPEIKAVLDITEDSLTPSELMQAILKAPAELLYFGGIGTYIKAPHQTHLEVGDKANDSIRVDATDIRAAVIGEGANLGITQAGRIALSQNGVRLNTDAIDNSAGVDCSDHEVNIKILLGRLVQSKRLGLNDRDALLASMTDEVGELVLKDNYAQSLALTLLESTAFEDNASMQAFITSLEKRGKLDRKVEGLPSNDALDARKAQSAGLCRPELAVVLAYGKIVLFDDLIATTAIDDQAFDHDLIHYFPTALHSLVEDIRHHRLHREIVATVLCNEMVNILGPSFASRLQKSAGVDTGALVLSFEAARRLFDTPSLWAEISELDNRIPAKAQTALYNELSLFLRRQVYYLARRFAGTPTALSEVIALYQKGVQTLMKLGCETMSEAESLRVNARVQRLVSLGAPNDLAFRIAALRSWTAATDMVDLSQNSGLDLVAISQTYFLAGERFGFDRLRSGAGDLYSPDPWDRMAIRRLIEDIMAEQKSVVSALLWALPSFDQAELKDPHAAIEAFAKAQSTLVAPVSHLISEMTSEANSGTGWSFAKLSIVNAVLREWVSRL
jgi:glutamate dehydrogenase